MMSLLLAILAGIAVLLVLVLWVRLHAFLALLLASVTTALLSGMPPEQIMVTVGKGMSDTLGFVATVVGLGAMFGAVLEHSGGAGAISAYLLRRLGTRRAPLAMAVTGLVVSIPVFFDVAFIILLPVLYALQRTTQKSLLLFALPLLAGLAVGHAFIPPTPGPVAVAEIIHVELGRVILWSLVVGTPVAIVAGIWVGNFASKGTFIAAPPASDLAAEQTDLPSVWVVLGMIFVPILLILMNTGVKSGLIRVGEATPFFYLIGHPFSALLVANLMSWYFLGIRRGMSREQLFDISSKSLVSAGAIILVTGAGGAFKQVLMDTGTGKTLATMMLSAGIPLLLFAYLAAVLIRVLQGSATVAMVTAASLTAPLIQDAGLTQNQLSCLVIAIAAGATMLSHVNDSGFWLVGQYLGLTERQTFRSWSLLTVVVSVLGFALTALLWTLL